MTNYKKIYKMLIIFIINRKQIVLCITYKNIMNVIKYEFICWLFGGGLLTTLKLVCVCIFFCKKIIWLTGMFFLIFSTLLTFKFIYYLNECEPIKWIIHYRPKVQKSYSLLQFMEIIEKKLQNSLIFISQSCPYVRIVLDTI